MVRAIFRRMVVVTMAVVATGVVATVSASAHTIDGHSRQIVSPQWCYGTEFGYVNTTVTLYRTATGFTPNGTIGQGTRVTLADWGGNRYWVSWSGSGQTGWIPQWAFTSDDDRTC